MEEDITERQIRAVKRDFSETLPLFEVPISYHCFYAAVIYFLDIKKTGTRHDAPPIPFNYCQNATKYHQMPPNAFNIYIIVGKLKFRNRSAPSVHSFCK